MVANGDFLSPFFAENNALVIFLLSKMKAIKQMRNLIFISNK